MADRFVADILSDGSPMVATSRYTDQLFGGGASQQQQPKSSASPADLVTGYHNLNDDPYATPVNRENRALSSASIAALRAENGDDDDSDRFRVGDRATATDIGTAVSTNADAKTAQSAAPVMMESEDALRTAIANEVQWMLRFALLFINFTFIVAALLMTLAGATAANTPSLTICAKCQRLAVAPVVLGLLMWFSGFFAFYWIKQRNVLFLLLHAGVVLFVSLGILVVIIIGIAFNGSITELSEQDLLNAWTARRDNISDTIDSPLCNLQQKNNCSGVKYGCCQPGTCYNATWPPAWVAVVCAECFQRITPDGQNSQNGNANPNKERTLDELYPPQMCSWDVLQRTTSSDMVGFIVVLVFAFVLLSTGMGLAMFVRRINTAGSNSS